jgi:hypothetical protein
MSVLCGEGVGVEGERVAVLEGPGSLGEQDCRGAQHADAPVVAQRLGQSAAVEILAAQVESFDDRRRFDLADEVLGQDP